MSRLIRLPLSAAQLGIWLHLQAEPQRAIQYLVSSHLRLHGPIDRQLFEKALQYTVSTTTALRARLRIEKDEIWQDVMEGSAGVFNYLDLSEELDPEQKALQFIDQDNQVPIVLLEDASFYWYLIRTGPEQYYWHYKYHHLFLDAIASTLVRERVAAAYAQLVRGEALDELDDIDAYRHYIKSYNLYRNSPEFTRDRVFWSKYSREEPTTLSLRTAGRNVCVPIESRRLRITDAEILTPIHRVCAELGVTLPQFMIALTVLYLRRSTQSESISIGVPTHGRFDDAMRNLAAMCADILPISFEVDPSVDVREFIQSVRDQMGIAFKHRRHRRKDIREALHIKPTDDDALFRVIVNALPITNRLSLEHGYADTVGARASTYMDDLMVWIFYGREGDILSIILSGNEELYSTWELDAHVHAMESLLLEIIADRRRPVSELSLLSIGLQKKVLVERNATKKSCVNEFTVSLFERCVKAAPDAVAIVFGEDEITYAQLNHRANRVAHQLRQQGIGLEGLVAILVERGIDMVVALLGVMKSGGAYLPLHPESPRDRLAFMLDDALPSVVITDAMLIDRVPPSISRSVVRIDELDLFEDCSDDNLPQAEHRDHALAYVIYTSGSTGKPKGVAVEHGSLINLLYSMQSTLEVTSGDCMLAVTTLSFDIAALEIFLPLICGARVVVASDDMTVDATRLASAISEHRVTLMQATPATWRLLCADAPRERFHIKALCGGEALTSQLAKQLCERVDALWNVYGPTETTIWSCLHRIDIQDEHGRVNESIGRPISNTRIYILDEGLQPLPVGVRGEIYIGGVGVARGYLNRPELTAERFLKDPFSDEPNARMYKSGDLGRWLPDGTIEFLGRNDFQVKIRGFRIELGEIEARIAEHPSVKEAVVIASTKESGEKRLIAYVVGRAEAADVDGLRTYLKNALPEYMVPSAIVVLDRLPLTPNGKVDRKALPTPELDAFALKQYEAPQGETENAVANLWSDVLQLERIGRHDHFFEIGGHSLLAVKMISRVRQVLGVEVPLARLFTSPTLSGFAQEVSTSVHASLPPIEPVSRDQPVSLSFAQQRLWFLAQLGEASSEAYHTPIGLRLTGSIDRTALQSALNRIVERHEVLRTRFIAVQGTPLQRIYPAEPVLLIEHDVREHADANAELTRLIEQEVRTPFDLEREQLIRARLIRESDQRYVVLLTQHHIATDGWSISVLIDELSALYRASLQSTPDPLPPLKVQYADYAMWQRQWVAGEMLQQQITYWKDTLADAPEQLELPTDRPRSLQQDYRGGRIDFTWDTTLTRGITELSRRHGLTNFMTVLASWMTLLCRLSGQRDVVTGVATANRGRKEIEGLIGFFVNSLTLRLDVSDSPTVSALLARTKIQALAALQHQDIPFERVVDAVHPNRSLAHNPLFQVMFGWQNAPRGKLTLDGIERVELIEMPQYTAKFDLSVSLWEVGGTITGNIEYAEALFDRSTVERYLTHWQTLLAAMVSDDHQAVDRLPMLTDSERQQILYQWNDTDRVYPKQCIHQLFEEQVDSAPHALAIIQDQRQVTYAELNRYANQLAHRLQEAGVKPGDRVVTLLDRSIELVVAELAILKCGAAYVPLDVEFPAERQALLIQDCEASIVVARADEDLRFDVSTLTRVDVEWNELAVYADTNLSIIIDDESLAYVMYTSGSTGKPKGVMIPHRAIKRVVINNGYAEFNATDRIALAANPAFDASTMEMWGALLNGGACVVIDHNTFLDPHRFAAILKQQHITVLLMTTALFNHYARTIPATFATMRALLTGGERCDPVSFAQVRRNGGPQRLIHVYGPTETTTFATSFEVQTVADGVITLPIGRPISNTSIYILDARSEPVPIGVTGEIFIGGDGVALGYLNRLELTAERFLPDPFARKPNARMYKTGDLARWLPDGNVEFIGRNDFQVKIRGFRIELGEIEAQLRAQEGIEEAVVVARGERPDDKHLVAYLTVQPGYRPDALKELEDKKIEQWHVLYEDTYGNEEVNESLTDFVGWNSSYTSEPIPLVEMQEWHRNTLDRIAELKPNRVLEIGCGSGLLLLHLAPHCADYIGTDFSESTIRRLQQKVSKHALTNVRLLHRTAEDFSNIEPGSVDTVIINSVIQYFPDVDYLLKVIEGAWTALSPTGSLFIGDIRNLKLLEVFHASVQLYRAKPDDSAAEIKERVRKAVEMEKEFLVDPNFFAALKERLPGLKTIRVMPKIGRYVNELTKYRYDVALRKNQIESAMLTPQVADWVSQSLSIDDLKHLLQQGLNDSILVIRISNAHLIEDEVGYDALANKENVFKKVSEIRKFQCRQDMPRSGIGPHALQELAESFGYRVQFDWCGGERSEYRAFFCRRDIGECFYFPLSKTTDIYRFANAPLRDSIRRCLAEAVKIAIKNVLPYHMIPARLVFVDRFALTATGKIDRAALPKFELERIASDHIEPATALEKDIAHIWADTLKVEKIGVADHFFDLGGHSLSAVQVISRLREVLGIEVALNTIFAHPTLGAFAAAVAEERRIALPEIVSGSRSSELPLSFSQQRLFFLSSLNQKASTAYHMPFGFRLRGSLNRHSLRAALNRILERHEALRTTFAVVGGTPIQRISTINCAQFHLVEYDLRDNGAASLSKIMEDEARNPFDLGRGPLIRGRLVAESDGDSVLLITMHHIISDGWSLGIFMRELSALYTAHVRGEPDPLLPLTVQYPDYALWQRRWITGEMLRSQAEYWEKTLAGAPALLDLPIDRPRPAEHDYSGSVLEFRLAGELIDNVKEMARRNGVTLYMGLLAGWIAMLARLSGQDDIVVGTPIANRGQREVEPLIGFFVNTLAIRVGVPDSSNVRQLLAQVKTAVLGAMQNQEVPFEQVVERIRPERSMAHHPIFQVLFGAQGIGSAPAAFDGLFVERLPVSHTLNSAFDLLASFRELGSEAIGTVLYATALFDRSTVQRFVEHWMMILKGMSECDERHIHTLPMLDDEKRLRLLDEYSAGPVIPMSNQFVHHLFESTVAKSPEAIALIAGDRRLTYKELNDRASILARYLRKLGVDADQLVVVCLNRSIEMIVAALGVLKAGGAYVPIDPEYPSERIRYMLDDSNAKIVLTQGSLKTMFGDSASRVLALDSEWDLIAELGDISSDHTSTKLRSKSLAYVIYTSGSTGRPKGVMIEHLGLCNFVLSVISRFDIRSTSRVLQSASFSFDLSVSDIFSALCSGAALYLAVDEDMLIGERLCEVLCSQDITHATLTPTAVGTLDVDKLVGKLNTLIVAGESCSMNLAKQWSVGRRFINGYGPTEITVCATTHMFDSDDTAVLIGRPLPNTRVYILDKHGEPVPIGVAGEIYVGGVGVARGYLNKPELTAERFLVDSFSREPEAVMYRTGDLGRWRSDGKIEFLGRNDHQVKIRGFRIELGEIESQLLRCEEIKEAAVIARDDTYGEKQLVAYVTTREGYAFNVGNVRAALKMALPEYMIPGAMVALDVMPLTPNGKLDRKALPAPEHTAFSLREYAMPQGDVEEALTVIWRDLLHIERIGRHDNFFDIGGHSLMILRLMSRAEQVGLSFTATDLFRYPTIAALTAALTGRKTTLDAALLIQEGSGPPLFLMHDGAGLLLYAHRLAPLLNGGLPVYGLPAPVINDAMPTTVEAMATRMVKLIREVQPHGPYRLAGWSFGGLLAYEVAQQLVQGNQAVEFLGLFDAMVERPSSMPTIGQVSDLQRYGLSTSSNDEDARQLIRIKIFNDAISNYRASPTSCTIDLFVADDSEFLNRNNEYGGWSKVLSAAQLRTYSVPGTHYTMMAAENITQIATILDSLLK